MLRTTLAVACLMAAACGGDDEFELFVDVQTDIVPEMEFDLVHAELLDERGPLGDVLRTADHGIIAGEPYLSGARVAELSGLRAGDYVLRVELRDGTTPIASVLAAVAITDDRAVTVIVTRSCLGVSCPMLGDDPGATSCFAGRCAAPVCGVTDAPSCPSECSAVTDCGPVDGCTTDACVRGACFYDCRGGPPGDTGPMDSGVPDSAPTDTSPPSDAGLPELIAWYRMDDDPSDGVVDETGNGHDGACTTSQCPSRVPGRIGDAYAFDGDDVIMVPHDASLESRDGITVAAWVRLRSASLSADNGIATIPFGSDDQNSWEMFFDGDNGRAVFGIAHASFMDRASAVSARPTEWTHVVGTFDGMVIRLYQDGLLTDTDDFVSPIMFDGHPMFIGADQNSGTVRGFMNGDIDELRIYGGALTDEQVMMVATSP